MRTTRIVSDSASDLLSLQAVDFAYAPMKIITAEREFVDDPSLDVGAMTEMLEHYKGRSQSSCPNPNDWLSAFGDAEDIYCVTITSGLSGSYNSACAAKQLYEAAHPGRRVCVVDSLSAGPEITLMVRKLEEFVRAGMEYDAVCAAIAEYKKNTGLIFMLKCLNNFANNGRVSPLVAKLVGIAGICIAGRASAEGTLDPTHKCRGEAHALNTLLSDLMTLGLRRGRVSIGHCLNADAAERFREKLLSAFEGIEVEIHELRGLCSFYAEKGGMLVGFEKM